MICEEMSGRKWVVLKSRWSVGKTIDVIGEKLKFRARDSAGKRSDPVINGKAQDGRN